MSELFKVFDNAFKDFEKMVGDIDFEINDKIKFPSRDDLKFKYTEEVVETDTQVTVKEVWSGLDGRVVFSRTSTSPLVAKKTTLSKVVEDLTAKMKKAASDLDYKLAAEFQEQLNKLKSRIKDEDKEPESVA